MSRGDIHVLIAERRTALDAPKRSRRRKAMLGLTALMALALGGGLVALALARSG